MAREWHAPHKPAWPTHHGWDVSIGTLPIRKITAPPIVDIVRAIESQGANETAGRIRQRISNTNPR